MLSSSLFEPDYEGAYYIDRCSEGFDRIIRYLDTGVLSCEGLNKYEQECVYENLDYFSIPYKRKCAFTEATLIKGFVAIVYTQLMDGRLCGTNFNDNSLCLWNVDTNLMEKTFIGHDEFVMCAIELEDGRICSSSEDGSIRLWNAASGECNLTIEKYVTCVIQLRDGRLCGCEHYVNIWNAATGACELTVNTNSYIRSIIQLDDGRLCCENSNHNIVILT
jgi:WD40 repeat protein